jgi:hypothetical protein
MEPLVAVEPAMIPTTTVIPIAMTIVAAAIVRVAVEAMEPRTGADEDSVHEVIRSPIAVGRASVRSIWIVAVGADRRSADSDTYGSYSNSDSYSYLCARNGAHREHQNTKNRSIFKITHLRPPSWPAPSRFDFASSSITALKALHASEEKQDECQTLQPEVMPCRSIRYQEGSGEMLPKRSLNVLAVNHQLR